MEKIVFGVSKKITFLFGILFCLTLSAALVYASYWMIVWDFSEHPDAPVDNKKKSYGDSIQRQAELSCKNHCLEIPSAVSYTMRLSEKDSKFFCSCYNENKVLIIVTEWEIR